MNTAKPIKAYEDVQKFKQYYLAKGEYRNYLLVSVGLNSALRISDVLSLKWDNFFDFKSHSFKKHIELTEKKTGKQTQILINPNMLEAIKLYMDKCENFACGNYIFANSEGNPITRMQAHRIIKAGGNSIGLDLSCHSLRKTFGCHAWKKGVPPVMLMKIYNHSTFEITKRYLGIEQDDKDLVFESMGL
jgi:integrase